MTLKSSPSEVIYKECTGTPHTKFEVPSFIVCKDINGHPQFKNGQSRDLDHAPYRRGWSSICYDLLRPTYVPKSLSPPIKKTYKPLRKCEKWVVCGSSKSLKITASNKNTEPMWVPQQLYVPILHHFWDIAKYWSKIADFNLPHLYLAPPLGVRPL